MTKVATSSAKSRVANLQRTAAATVDRVIQWKRIWVLAAVISGLAFVHPAAAQQYWGEPVAWNGPLEYSWAPVEYWNAPAIYEPTWASNTVARGPELEMIGATPLLDRPNRPGHFLGNTIRRIFYRGQVLPSRADIRHNIYGAY